ncbi:protein SHQ1 homolog isoform X1 [Perca fluviatilis]|uniref:protein SHQ1 homolog isoform X1 n=1 Tax=Perca fluviatilis TaxID=8168 RepID=UPI0019663C64|nr:protein SHQ1 homolog isoform X1 [Perca fluviatilis]XP_039653436.1 protein SHQ1 homolog isoform X1 [Perca fluviatilis]XP_039653437.1 protein SHQ1 homolog isoform X1 [Perca fluviatilis]
MITPAFDLSQDAEYLILSIRVPYTRTSEFDLYIDGSDFKFYAKPYFLRLSLPGRIVEDGREKAKFDIDKGLVTLWVPKETAGEHFEGLQMLTSLLAPKGSRSAKPLIEDLSTGLLQSGCSEAAGDDEDDDEEEFDWQVEQEVYKESSEEELRALPKYGFGNRRSGVFARLQEELSDVTDIKNPEGRPAAERRQARLDAEAAAFSPDHYLADLFEDEEIKGLLKFRPWWAKLSPSTEQEGEAAVSFNDGEKEQLRKFTNRSYLLDKTSRYQVWLSLVDILLAYSYEVRSTEGEHNVESAWTIRKLSGTLCWLETYSSLQDVLVSFGRRVLCYPLYRHFSMVSAVVRDTTKILQSGKACVLKCLLDIHKVFRENDPAYILNDLYITDYCIWIQRVKSKKMSALAATLQKASLQKKDLELALEELEQAAAMVAEEEEGEQGASDCSSASSDSSSDSSDESEESEAEGQGCTKSNQGGGGGGGGGGGEMSKDNPLQPQPSSAASPIPQEPTSTLFSAERKVDALPSASEGSRQLIQELGERVAEGLKISQGCIYEAERKCSQANNAAAKTEATSGRSSGGTLLEPSPRRNPLLIVQSQEDLDQSDFIC